MKGEDVMEGEEKQRQQTTVLEVEGSALDYM